MLTSVMWRSRVRTDSCQLQTSTMYHHFFHSHGYLYRPSQYPMFRLTVHRSLLFRWSISNIVTVGKTEPPEQLFPIPSTSSQLYLLSVFKSFFSLLVFHWPILLPLQLLLFTTTLQKTDLRCCIHCHCSPWKIVFYAYLLLAIPITSAHCQ